MKILKLPIISLTSIILLLAFSLSAFAKSYDCWYIKRQGNCRPLFPDNAEEIEKLGALFIDENSTDEDKRIYLTFDAGYENGNIEKILDVLKAENIPAAFFILDNLIIKNPSLVKRMADEGHLVCNHTKNHKNICSLSQEKIKEDLESLERLCYEKTGVVMTKFFRFPKGEYTTDAVKKLKNLGYTSVFWSFAYDDWDNCRQPSEGQSKRKILDNTHNGEILLLHPTSETNKNILPELIKCWRQMGYKFGSLDEIKTS